MWPNEAGRSKVQANKLGQSLHTAVDLGSFPQLALAPKLMPALGWGTWTSEWHVNTLSSLQTLCHQLHLSRTIPYIKVSPESKRSGNFSEPILFSYSLWFCFWGTASLNPSLSPYETCNWFIFIRCCFKADVHKHSQELFKECHHKSSTSEILGFCNKIHLLVFKSIFPSLNRWDLHFRKTQ